MKPKPVVLLGNGPSILDVDFSQIDCPVVGLNKSWLLSREPFNRPVPEPIFHVAVDQDHLWDIIQKKHTPRLLYTSEGRDTGQFEKEFPFMKLPLRGGPGWSHDVFTRGVFTGSVVHVALQIVAALGYRPIFLLGVDMKEREGKRRFFDGGPPGGEYMQMQLPLFRLAARGLQEAESECVNLCPDSALGVFARMKFEDVFPIRRK